MVISSANIQIALLVLASQLALFGLIEILTRIRKNHRKARWPSTAIRRTVAKTNQPSQAQNADSANRLACS